MMTTMMMRDEGRETRRWMDGIPGWVGLAEGLGGVVDLLWPLAGGRGILVVLLLFCYFVRGRCSSICAWSGFFNCKGLVVRELRFVFLACVAITLHRLWLRSSVAARLGFHDVGSFHV